jgi:hypothetical protein
MRFYIVVEGAGGEPKIYPKWINYINSEFKQVYNISDTADNTFFLTSGFGYPNYLKIIDNAIEDINQGGNFDCLVIGVDSEDMPYKEKHNEISQYIGNRLYKARLKIIIQNPCLETWALGNRIACRKNTTDTTLLEYLKIFNVRSNDPELLPDFPEREMNRAQFAFTYLKCMLHDWYPHAVYTKSNPKALLDENYFLQIKKRLIETKHIQSFQSFLDAFQEDK